MISAYAWKRQSWDVSPGLQARVHCLLVAQLPGLAVGDGELGPSTRGG